jgi:hypothetical protein
MGGQWMDTPTPSDAISDAREQAKPASSAAPAGGEGRSTEVLVMAIIFAVAAAEVIALCAFLW